MAKRHTSHKHHKAHEGGRRTHPHAFHGDTMHDEHIRHDKDMDNTTHLHNAMKHLDAQHAETDSDTDPQEMHLRHKRQTPGV